MATENTNSDAPASESALSHPLSIDDAMGVDLYDPDEDTEEIEGAEQSDDEAVEADDETDGQDETADDDAESDDEAGDGDEDQPEAAEVKDDVTITLQSGETIPLGELKSGYMRQADYSRKTQELGTKRRDLEALATNVQSAVAAIAEHLSQTLPKAPDPNLAITDPNKYTRMKALHDHAMAQIGEVVKAAHAPQNAVNTLNEQQHRELVASETAKLNDAFPQTRTQEGHKAFFDAASETARQLGYSDEEIGSAVDHRLFKLAHYARLGMQAEAAKTKARQKVQNAPPVAKAKRPQGQNVAATKRNADAVRRLQKTGSIEDAMAIDFE